LAFVGGSLRSSAFGAEFPAIAFGKAKGELMNLPKGPSCEF